MCIKIYGFPDASAAKNLLAGDARDVGSIPGLGKSPGIGNGNPLLYSCLGNPMDRGSLVGYSPWGHKKLDTTEELRTHTHTYTQGWQIGRTKGSNLAEGWLHSTANIEFIREDTGDCIQVGSSPVSSFV